MGQTGAALRAAASQDLAAVGGTHTLTEPVLLGEMCIRDSLCSEDAKYISGETITMQGGSGLRP